MNGCERCLGKCVLPHANYLPSGSGQALVDALITPYYTIELRDPVRSIHARRGSVFFTRVPEAAIHKYGNSALRKYDVWPYTGPLNLNAMVDSESVATCV